jgi:hypothetical protein
MPDGAACGARPQGLDELSMSSKPQVTTSDFGTARSPCRDPVRTVRALRITAKCEFSPPTTNKNEFCAERTKTSAQLAPAGEPSLTKRLFD